MRKMLLGGVTVPVGAAGDLGFYSTAELLTVIRHPAIAPELKQFWTKFFPRTLTSTSERIYFEEIDDNEYRLAPFVAPNVQGVMMASKGSEVKSFKPAYVKPKHVVEPSRSIPRRTGEALLGSSTPQQRYDAIIADNMRRERLMIENRWEWLACKALTDGEVVIKGENYPEVTVDFGRDASLTNVLSGTARWNLSTAVPISDITLMNRKAFRASGAPITDLIFGLDAMANFLLSTHGDVQELLNTLRRGNESLFNASNITDGGPYQYMGDIMGTGGLGRMRLWTYSNFYESLGDGQDDAGAKGDGIPFFDPKCVIGVGGAVNGLKCFGAILDKGANLQVLPIFPKMWSQEDPSVTYTMCQSAPLMVPMGMNNTWKMQVIT